MLPPSFLSTTLQGGKRGSMNPKPTPNQILQQINQYIVSHSGFEEKRDYVSMSHISECPRKVVREYLNGFQVDAHTHHMCYAGYHHEDDMIKMLTQLGLITKTNVEVMAPFDSRLRGHLDALLEETVIELKSISGRQWDSLKENADRAMWKHYVQVQLYMRYGNFPRALVIYRNRETFQHMVIEVPYSEPQAERFEGRARFVLQALDAGIMPECECKHCRE